MKVYEQDEICEKFTNYVQKKLGGVANAVEKYGVTRAYISNIKRNLAAPNATMLQDIGFERKNGFVRVKK